jgi:DNA polymerase I-like protein with 3'-5' exonuclease and polymerase domains
MIYLITGRRSEYSWVEESAEVEFAKGRDFSNWIDLYEEDIQLDTETNIVEGLYGWKGYLKGINKTFAVTLNDDGNRIPEKRECYVVQVGDIEGEDQYIFDVQGLTGAQHKAMLLAFTCKNRKLIHNGLFDYGVILWNFGIAIKNIRDTFLMSKIVTTGLEVGTDLPKGHNSLAGCAKRYLGIDISKAVQTSFDGSPMSQEQVEYAAVDVVIPGAIYPHLQAEVDKWGVENVVRLECALIRPYGNAMCENLYLDPKPWAENMKIQFAKVVEVEADFHQMMIEAFPEDCVRLGFVQGHDEYLFNWRSPNMKKAMMRYLYPSIPANTSTAKEYKEFYEGVVDTDGEINPTYLGWMLEKNHEALETYFVSQHNDFLKDIEIFIPKGTVKINLKSPAQKLELFKLIQPAIQNTDKETIKKINHPLAKKLAEYNKASKMSTSYGQNFLDAISPDGMFRVKKFTPILNTGRSSMSMLQLLPGDNTYRNCFNPNNPKTGTREDGHVWKVVGADYASQEAVVAATFSGEEAFLTALEMGYDFHSSCTSFMFPDEWKALGGEDKPMGKPKDKKLLGLRQSSKVTSFGIMYGKSAIGLGDSLNLPATTDALMDAYPSEVEAYLLEQEEDYSEFRRGHSKSGRDTRRCRHDYLKLAHQAKLFLPDVVTGDDLIIRFHNAFPKMAAFLENSSQEGLENKYIVTPDVFQRVRRFPHPEHQGDESSIKRAAQNFKIQSSSANMTKYAICIMQNYIEDNDLTHKMKFCLPLHDEVRYIARADFAEEALEIVITHMEKAGEFVLGSTLQKAEGEITDLWAK